MVLPGLYRSPRYTWSTKCIETSYANILDALCIRDFAVLCRRKVRIKGSVCPVLTPEVIGFTFLTPDSPLFRQKWLQLLLLTSLKFYTPTAVYIPKTWNCCNLSLGVALNVSFTTNEMCAKNNTKYMWREQAITEWSWHVNSTVLLLAAAVWSFAHLPSGFPIATKQRYRMICCSHPNQIWFTSFPRVYLGYNHNKSTIA